MRIVTWANGLTFGRLIMFFVAVWKLIEGDPVASIWLIIVAWALDGIDGFLARYLNETTKLGSLLDKVADRLILGGGIVLWVMYGVLPWYTLFLLTKDVLLLPLFFFSNRGALFRAGVGWMGKSMTLFQGMAVLWLLFHVPGGEIIAGIGCVLGIVVAVRYYRQLLRHTMPMNT